MYPTTTRGYTNEYETQFSDKFKATVALKALRGDKTAQKIAAKHKIHLLPAGVCLQTPRGNASDDMETAGD
jgi:transposase-like protein